MYFWCFGCFSFMSFIMKNPPAKSIHGTIFVTVSMSADVTSFAAARYPMKLPDTKIEFCFQSKL